MTGLGRLAAMPAFRRAILLRSLGTWIGIRLAAAFLTLVALNPVQAALVVAAVAAAVLFDARRRDEHVLLGNLGIAPGAVAALAVPVPLALEAVAAMVAVVVAP